MANLLAKLAKVQSELKAPKYKENKFGGYKYRSCEGILEAVKPLLKKNGLAMVITDEITEIGGRIYVKATAKIWDAENPDSITEFLTTTAYAREEENRKGMTADQLTGACSSYARKYCLNGLFLIDDTKDADATNEGQEKASQKVTEASKILCSDCGKEIAAYKGKGKDGKQHTWNADFIAENSKAKTGRCLCWDCWMKEADKMRAQAEQEAQNA